MSEAKLDIGGSTQVAQREIDRLTREVAKMREVVRKANEEWREGAVKTSKANDGMTASLTRFLKENNSWSRGMQTLSSQNDAFRRSQIPMVGMMDRFKTAMSGAGHEAQHLGGEINHTVRDMLAAGAAALTLEKAYEAWAAEVERVAEGHTQLSLSVTQTLAEAGKLKLGPKAEQFIKEGVPGATPEEARAALAGVLQTGRKLTDQRTFDVAREIGKLSPTKIDLTQAGGLAGHVANLVGEGVSAEDVADLTIGIKQQLREKTDEFTGHRFQRALEDLKVSKHLTGEDALAYGVAAARSEQGAAALRSLAHKGPKTTDERRAIREAFDPTELARIKAEQAQFRTGNVAAGELTALEQFQQGREALRESKLEEERAKTQEKLGPLFAERERQRNIVRERAYRSSYARGVYADVTMPFARAADVGAGAEAAGINFARTAGQAGAFGQALITPREVSEFTSALKDAAAASRELSGSMKTRQHVDVERHTESYGVGGSW